MDTFLAIALRSLMSRKSWTQYQHMLDEDTFPNQQAAALYVLLRDMHASSRSSVDEIALRSAIEATTKGSRRKELLGVVDSIMEEGEIDEGQTDYAIRQYVARGKAARAARMVITHSDSPVFDYGVPAKLLSDAAIVAHGETVDAVEARTAGLPGDEEMVRNYVPLGLSDDLDAALGGGVGRGELLVFMATFGRGKTSYMWRATANAALAGENCWTSTMEVAPYKCINRYYQCLTGLTTLEMIGARALVSGRRAQVPGQVWFNDHRGRAKLSPASLAAALERAQDEGKEISYVMLDYAGIMKADGDMRGRGDHRIKGEMLVDLRGVAADFDVPIITGWQVNRVGSSKLVFGPEDVADSWEVVQHADIVLGLNQTPDELRDGIMRIKIMKQREDTARDLLYLSSDLRRMKISALEGSEYEGPDEEAP